MEPATLRLYSWSSVLQAKAPKKSAGKTQIWEREKTSWNSNNEPPSSFCTTTKGSPSRSALSFFSSPSHLHWLSSSVFLLQASATDWHPLVQHWVAKRMQNAPNWRRTPCDGLYWPIPSVGKVVNLRSVWVMWGLTTVILIIWTHCWVDRRAPSQRTTGLTLIFCCILTLFLDALPIIRHSKKEVTVFWFKGYIWRIF